MASGRRYGIASLEQMVAFLQRSCAEEEAFTRRPMLPDEAPRIDQATFLEEEQKCPPG